MWVLSEYGDTKRTPLYLKSYVMMVQMTSIEKTTKEVGKGIKRAFPLNYWKDSNFPTEISFKLNAF